jgi:hypothetical protein
MSDLSLSDFLLARLAEDEADVYPLDTDESGKTIYADLGSARVLREVEAMRRIVADYNRCLEYDALTEWSPTAASGVHGERIGLEQAVCALAGIWADHPDYREEWKL